MRIWAIAAIIMATPAAAQQASLINDDAIKAYLDEGQEFESRTDGDINGDGQVDTILIGRSDEVRTLKALLLDKGEFDVDMTTAGTLKLEPFPLGGSASVSFAKGGVVKIEDLTGGTTAINAVYRYRLVPGAKSRMRLIGLDATLYSRTYAHDGFELSWNLLTGDLITRDMHLNRSGKGDAAYDKITEKRAKRPSKPLYMEDTPSPEELIEAVRK